MFIKVEPAGFFMHTVKLIFDLDCPNSEDGPVREYLAEHELEPRYRWDDDLEGNRAEVLQFGGCYLGNHLQGIGQIQRNAVEVELLTAEISRHLDSVLDGQALLPALLTEERRQAAICALVSEFQGESAFQTNEQGELTAVLEEAEVREAARRVLDL
ncbi:MAG: hypothetical protein IH870_01375 [Chloroflexi bacterium]|nr:hypothetical protein [Chloroflexota bacterium]